MENFEEKLIKKSRASNPTSNISSINQKDEKDENGEEKEEIKDNGAICSCNNCSLFCISLSMCILSLTKR